MLAVTVVALPQVAFGGPNAQPRANDLLCRANIPNAPNQYIVVGKSAVNDHHEGIVGPGDPISTNEKCRYFVTHVTGSFYEFRTVQLCGAESVEHICDAYGLRITNWDVDGFNNCLDDINFPDDWGTMGEGHMMPVGACAPITSNDF